MQFLATFLAVLLGTFIFAPVGRDDDSFVLLVFYIAFASLAAWARVA